MTGLAAPRPCAPMLRVVASVAVLAALAGCASQTPQISGAQRAAQYVAAARHDYQPPGPSADPWGPFIVEAARKYDVPELWVRQVMRQESGGRLYENGQLITSNAGAMGLMQVMPQTYEELRQRYGLGPDPFDPHDNIIAGTAYMRELYDLYGTPGFLAAYNAGPRRLDDYLTRNRPLPDETRNYVARIGPNIVGVYPQRLSPATQYAMNQLPINIPSGPRYPQHRAPAPVALAVSTPRSASRGEVQVAALPAPPRMVPPPPPQMVAFDTPPHPASHGFTLIPRAMADTLPLRGVAPVSGNWAIQVGAFASEPQARGAAAQAKLHVHDMLASARPLIGAVHQARATLYRARLTGLSHEAATQACEKLAQHGVCIVVSPDAQS